jgi:hypothetical protein
MAVLVNVFLHHSHAISTMPPSCARCAPTGSDASLVHYYGQPTAWGAPACLHAAACADRNSVTLSMQSIAAPVFGCAYGHGAMLKPLKGPQGGAGAWGSISKCGLRGTRAMRPSTRRAPHPAL